MLARFTINDTYVVDAMKHKRKERRVWFNSLKAVVILFALSLSLFAYSQGDFMVVAFFILCSIAILFAHRIDYWRAKRSVQKSPFNNEAVTVLFSDDAVQMKSSQHETILKWSVFTKAVHFDDGFLLYQGPMALTWIARTALPDPEEIGPLEVLLRSHIPHYLVVK